MCIVSKRKPCCYLIGVESQIEDAMIKIFVVKSCGYTKYKLR